MNLETIYVAILIAIMVILYGFAFNIDFAHVDKLDVTKANAWEPWILFMLKAVEETSRWTTAKIAAIRSLAETHYRICPAHSSKNLYSRVD